jgi:hypothetical protein
MKVRKLLEKESLKIAGGISTVMVGGVTPSEVEEKVAWMTPFVQ